LIETAEQLSIQMTFTSGAIIIRTSWDNHTWFTETFDFGKNQKKWGDA